MATMVTAILMRLAIVIMALTLANVQSEYQLNTVFEKMRIGDTKNPWKTEKEKCISMLNNRLSGFLQKFDRPYKSVNKTYSIIFSPIVDL